MERQPLSRHDHPAFDPKILLATAGDGKTFVKYGKGRTVFAQGDKADAVFYVQSGGVRVSVRSQQGKEAVVALLARGDFFGEGCLAGQSKRMTSIVALEDSAIVRIRKDAIVRMLHQEPNFSEVFTQHLLARSIRVEEDLIDQLFNSSEKRLARLLLLLANFGKEGKPTPMIPKISHDMLAEMIGTTRSRVTSFMNKFRRAGFIKYNGALEVHNSLLSVVLDDQKSETEASPPKTPRSLPKKKSKARRAPVRRRT